MKKIVFAFQVFGLIAAMPLIVVSEMNHDTSRLLIRNISPCIHEDPENTIIWEAKNFKEQFSCAILSLSSHLQNPNKNVASRSVLIKTVNTATIALAISQNLLNPSNSQ